MQLLHCHPATQSTGAALGLPQSCTPLLSRHPSRYKGVDAQSFGLSSSEILAMADKELNQVVGLKLLAPTPGTSTARCGQTTGP